MIGGGGRGGDNILFFAAENIVAICDVDEQRAARSLGLFPKAARYKDFRVMFEKQKDIDAVVVSTPDHTHAMASILAMRLGKHCYCEKPLTHDIWEARQMRDAAAKHKVATQMGNMGASAGNFRTGVEVIRAGVLGDVREVHVWTNRPTSWPQNINRPKNSDEVPKTLEWDLWLGPAPARPFVRDTYHPFKWRGWWDFGTGALGDMGCHTMNLAYMGLQLGLPTAVSADMATPLNRETYPLGATVTYEFPARGMLPACRLLWYEGGRRPPEKLFLGEKPERSGALLVGSKGTLYSPNDYGFEYRLLPRESFANFKPPERTLPRVLLHSSEWLAACRGGQPAMCNFVDAGAALTETVLLGNLAMRMGKRIAWDSEKMRAIDLPQANQYIRRECRKGWTL
jgi:predicted dehydrogenase